MNGSVMVSFVQVMAVQRTLEHDLELLCLTGVEDKLQVLLRHARNATATVTVWYVRPGEND